MNDELNGAQGKIFRVEPAQCRFELLKETAFDPRTHEGRSRYTIYWHDRTRFIKVVTQHSFAGLTGEFRACLRHLTEANAAAAAAGRDVVAGEVVILAAEEEDTGWPTDSRNLLVPFRPEPAAEQGRTGRVALNGKWVGLRLRGPGATVALRSVTDASAISRGFWAVTVHGRCHGDRFVADRLEIVPQVDPRAVDDPALPRILVIGDSISMNYDAAARAALRGIANYYRIDGNGGDSARGVVCAELWLGDYTQPGLHWDVIQFNHGLHDLRQTYDAATGQFGAHQVPPAEYQANLEREIQILQKTGATLVWCTTTPVPNDIIGATFARRKDEDLIYNQAALAVMRRHPEIALNDLNRFVRSCAALDRWRQGKDVHFWDATEQEWVGRAVAAALRDVLRKRKLPGPPAP